MAVVINSLIWKPFDVRFHGILDKIKFDQKIIQGELQYASIGGLESAMRSLEQQIRREMLSAVAVMDNEQDRRKFSTYLVTIFETQNVIC